MFFEKNEFDKNCGENGVNVQRHFLSLLSFLDLCKVVDLQEIFFGKNATLKEYSSIFAVWLYEGLLHNQSMTFCRWRSAVSLLGEERKNRNTVTGGVSRRVLMFIMFTM